MIQILSICPNEMKSVCTRDICTPVFISTLVTLTKIWKQHKFPLTDEYIKKMYLNTLGYYSATEK
jgi:hypothetical protein